jgi:hypothetical protein
MDKDGIAMIRNTPDGGVRHSVIVMDEGVFVDAHNGDIELAAAGNRIKLQAQSIEFRYFKADAGGKWETKNIQDLG